MSAKAKKILSDILYPLAVVAAVVGIWAIAAAAIPTYAPTESDAADICHNCKQVCIK